VGSILYDFKTGLTLLADNRKLLRLTIGLSLHTLGFMLSYTFIPLFASVEQGLEKTLVRYLMKKRKILLFTRNPAKAEEMFGKMPTHADVTSLRIRKSYDIKWEKVGTGEFRGARFAFKLEETQ
jgi:hypothetical protein